MYKLPAVLLILLLPIIVLGQQGVSFGIQSNYGVGRLTLESTPRTINVTPGSSFATGGSLFLQWNITDRFGFRLQAEGLYQGMNISVINPTAGNNFRGIQNSTVEDFGQGAANLQVSYNQPLNSKKTLRLEGYVGMGARFGSRSETGCGTGISGTMNPDDSLGIVTVNASKTVGNGSQVEIMGGFRFVQQVNSSERKPVYLTFGLGYRQALAAISRVEGIVYEDEVPVTTNRFGFVEFPFEELQEICLPGGFDTRPEDRYVLQHFGQQLDMQIGIRFGL